MAEAAGKCIWGCVVEAVKALGGEFWGYITSCDENMGKLKEKMSELKRKEEQVSNTILHEERYGKIPSKDAEWWLDEVESTLKASIDIEKMDAEFRSRKWTFVGGFSLDVFHSYDLSVKAKQNLADVETLLNKTLTSVVVESELDSYDNRTSGRSVEGMGSVVKKLQDHIADDNVNVIGIHGMGGVGKTTLLEKFRDEYLPTYINCKAVIDMGGRPTVEETQRAVAEKLRLQLGGKTELDRARQIFEFLDKKTFMLFLDNVWQKIDLDKVGVPIKKPRCKIILATRLRNVCHDMECQRSVRVECLQPDEAWSLFLKQAGKELGSSPHIRKDAEKLVRKCGGLPLALVHVGRTMKEKKSRSQWENAVKAMDTAKPDGIKFLVKDVLSRLRSSYDNLGDKGQKCLLYCTMYPEDKPIAKQWIMDHCIGEGVIDSNAYDDANEIYAAGYNLIDKLMDASLLERGADDDHIEMHPMIRLLVMWIASGQGGGSKMLVKLKHPLEESQVEKWTGAERVSVLMNRMRALSAIPDCPSLLSLILQYNKRLESICNGFFNSMTELRVLNLSRTSITELPAEIRVLLGLQYLDLCGTKITALPKELAELKLKFLLLEDTPHLETIPDGLIEGLPSLQVLYMQNSYGDWKVGSSGAGVDFRELVSLGELKAFGITVESRDALDELARSTKLAMSTSHLHVRGGHGLTTVSATRLERKHPALKSLRISDCGDLAQVVISSDNGSSDDDKEPPNPHLESLMLENLPGAQMVWRGGWLEHVRLLNVSGCNAMEQLIHCARVDENEGGPMSALPALKKMILSDLPNLRSISGGDRPLSFPSLEVLEVKDCEKLNKVAITASKLNDIGEQQAWWTRLQWEEEDDPKSRFPQLKIKYQGSCGN